jgi:hypothetical protein
MFLDGFMVIFKLAGAGGGGDDALEIHGFSQGIRDYTIALVTSMVTSYVWSLYSSF